MSATKSFSTSVTPDRRAAPEGSTGLIDVTVEGMAGILAAAAWEVIGDLGGVFIEISTLATTEVGLVTISWTAGSTTSVGKVGFS